jgi:hypothetical protein
VIAAMLDEGAKNEAIVERLNAEGLPTRRGYTWTVGNLDVVIGRLGLRRAFEDIDEFSGRMLPVIQDLQAEGLSIPAVTERLAAEGYKTRTGTEFNKHAVAAVLDRVGHGAAENDADDVELEAAE